MDELNYLVAIIPILIGVSSHLLPFIDTRKEFRERINLRRESLRENLAQDLENLLNHARSIQGTDELLRGQPDLVKIYTTETARVFDVLARIAWLIFWFRLGYRFLFVTTVGALAIVLGLLLAPEHTQFLRNVAVLVVALQVVAIAGIYKTCNQLDAHE